MTTRIMWVFFTVLLTGPLTFFSSQAQATKRIRTERLLSEVRISEMLENSYTYSNDLRRVGFRMKAGNKFVAVIDTLKGSPYDEIKYPVFSPDGNRFAYAARNGANWLLVVDHKQVAELDAGSDILAILFSPDSKKYIYMVRRGSKSHLVVNGRAGSDFDNIDENSIRFINNSKKLIFKATLDKKQCVVINGKKGNLYDQLGYPILSPNGKRLTYWVVDSNHTYVIEGKKRSKAYDAVASILFSHDSKHVLYQVNLDGQQLVVRDGVEGEKYETLDSPTFSEDGSRLAYVITQTPQEEDGFKSIAVVDGKKEGPYEQIMTESFVFSPDGKDLIFAVQLPLHEHEASPGVQHEAVGEWLILRNGKEGKRYEILPGIMMFSPDGLKLAYAGENNSKRMMNVNGIEESPFDDIHSAAFSPDSKRLAYCAKLGEKCVVVVNGETGTLYDSFLGQGEVKWDASDSLHYLVVNGNKIYRVEERFE